MANLETLELTINGSATSASEGISKLITSLSSLSGALTKPYSDLRDFNEALKETARLTKGIKMPNLGASTGARSAVAKVRKAVQDYDPAHNNGRGYIVPPTTADSLRKDHEWEVGFRKNATLDYVRRRDYHEWATQRREELAMAEAAKEAAKQVKEVSVATKESGQAAEKSASKFSGFTSKLGRIASTMIMRTAIRALIKNFQQAWNSAYEFSKKMNGSFAQSIDKIKGSLQSMSINIVRAFAPLAQVLAPVFSVIASGIKYITDAIIGLMRLLGVVSDMFGATAESIAGVGGSSGKAAKEVLASFDELNVIGQESGGGGGGGGGKSNFLDGFTEEIETVKMIVSESLLAVGLILAFAGHPAIGIALAAVGAATIVGTVATKWGTISEDVKGEITKIMVYAGGAMLALGAVIAFACPTKLGLGIALMAAGAANMVSGVALAWNLSDKVKSEISEITAKVGSAMLAIGAILALAVPGARGLGIGMMIAGGVSLASSVALNWDSLKDAVVRVFNTIKEKIVSAWNKVSDAVTGAWESVKTWAGATWENIGKGWERIKVKLASVWESVKAKIVTAWNHVKEWASATWENIGKGWERIKSKLSGVWDTIKTKVSLAWSKVSEWFSATWSNISSGWEGIQKGLEGVWGKVQEAGAAAWDAIKEFFGDPLGMLKNAWDGLVEWFTNNIINPVRKLLGQDPITLDIDDLVEVEGTDEFKEAIEGILNISVGEAVSKENLKKIKERFPKMDAATIFQFSNFTEMGLEARNQTIAAFATVFGAEGMEEIKKHCPNIDASYVLSTVNWDVLSQNEQKDFVVAMVSAFGASGISAIKSKLPNISATSLLMITNWDSFTTEQKFEFLNAIKDAFGSAEAIKAAKNSGINIGNLVAEGMNSKDDKIKKEAQDWNKLINNGVTNPAPIITPELQRSAVEGIKTTVNTILDIFEPKVQPKEEKWATENTKNSIENAFSGGFFTSVFVRENYKSTQDTYNSIVDTVGNVTANVTATLSNANQLKTTVENAIKGVKVAIEQVVDGISTVIGNIKLTASGGFLNEGQIFIAREAGPEMVGTIGNSTAVANNDQIVAGIANGVAAANESQNNLLREQNNLLRAILAKDTSAKFTASSALGRVVSQSLDMYGTMVGGRG